MKKVGILPLPLRENYGGMIQAAALYHIVNELGHKAVLIDKKYSQPFLKTYLKKVFSSNPLYKIYDVSNLTQRKKNLKELDRFKSQYFESKTKEIFSDSQIKNNTEGLDTVIVGSDQVWRYRYVSKDYQTYFLDFVCDKQRKISYAASLGVDKWEGDEDTVKVVKELLKRFDAVSVREDSGVNVCKEVFEYEKAMHVLDPTLLPKRSFYDELIKNESITKEIGVFNYVLDDNAENAKLIQTIGKRLGLPVDKIELLANKHKPSIEEWLYHFKKAEFVITDSFHGTIFSIIYNKPFIVLVNKSRGASRFESICRLLGLENRLLFSPDVNKAKILMDKKIDYAVVNDKLEQLREKSLAYLQKNI